MPEITVDIEVWCAKCGTGLCQGTTATTHRGRPGFDVEPCPKCMSAENDAGFEVGYDQAKDEFS